MFILQDDSWGLNRLERVILEVGLALPETVSLLPAGQLGEVPTSSDEEQAAG